MKNLFQRTISGIAYLIVVIGSLFLGKYAFGSLFLVISLIALAEYFSISGYAGSEEVTIIGLISGAAAFILLYLCASGILNNSYSYTLFFIPVVFMITGLFLKNDSVKRISMLFIGFFYISVPMALTSFLAFPSINQNHYTHRILLGLLALVWINDTGAYVTGMLFGRHKMFERISPKKSWEGFAGGTMFTILAAFFMNRLMGISDRFEWIVLAVIVCIFGVYGDLAESLIKRNVQVKDSGTLIPGHGGVLDRFDSMLFVVPVSFIYLIIRGI